jgi:putative ABC transport system permease protein
MESFFKDLKHSVRMFLHSPAFTSTAILALALGVGTNTAIFTLIDRVLLKPMPYPDADRMYS